MAYRAEEKPSREDKYHDEGKIASTSFFNNRRRHRGQSLGKRGNRGAASRDLVSRPGKKRSHARSRALQGLVGAARGS